MTADSAHSPKKKASETSCRSRRRGARLAIGYEERQHLIEACAFFHVEQFRPAAPGSVRAQDLKDAAAEIDAVLKQGKGRGRKR